MITTDEKSQVGEVMNVMEIRLGGKYLEIEDKIETSDTNIEPQITPKTCEYVFKLINTFPKG